MTFMICATVESSRKKDRKFSPPSFFTVEVEAQNDHQAVLRGVRRLKADHPHLSDRRLKFTHVTVTVVS